MSPKVARILKRLCRGFGHVWLTLNAIVIIFGILDPFLNKPFWEALAEVIEFFSPADYWKYWLYLLQISPAFGAYWLAAMLQKKESRSEDQAETIESVVLVASVILSGSIIFHAWVFAWDLKVVDRGSFLKFNRITGTILLCEISERSGSTICVRQKLSIKKPKGK